MSNGAEGPRATRREWIGLAVIALPCILYSMDLTVLHLAVPQISADLKPSAAQLLWIFGTAVSSRLTGAAKHKSARRRRFRGADAPRGRFGRHEPNRRRRMT
jgi:hypothetical protein